jgi:hypothetical protein
MVKIIGEFGSDGNQSLLLELPSSLLQDIEIAADGTVEIASLIRVLNRSYQDKLLDCSLEAIERIDRYDAIFNSDRAVSEKSVSKHSP